MTAAPWSRRMAPHGRGVVAAELVMVDTAVLGGSAWTMAAVSRGIRCRSRCSACSARAAFHHRRRIDHDLALGPQGVTYPAQPDLTEAEHALGGQQLGLDPVDQLEVDRVHQPPVDLAGGITQHDQDRSRDEQPHQRVREQEPQRHAGSPQQHRR